MTPRQMIEARIADKGIVMAKKLSSGGLFATDVYDRRTVFSLEDMFKLNREGFGIDQDVATLLLNALIAKSGSEE